jgi:hypothetical protein
MIEKLEVRFERGTACHGLVEGRGPQQIDRGDGVDAR